MYEVVNPATRESDGYFQTYSDAVEFGLTDWQAFEIWAVADDEYRTRVKRIYPREVAATAAPDLPAEVADALTPRGLRHG
jgi:hypothetical protein